MTDEKKPKQVKHMGGRDLEMDCVKKIYRQLDRLPNIKDAMRVLSYVQSVTHDGSPAYAKQEKLPLPTPNGFGPITSFEE